MKATTEITTITFQVTVEWPECDVDAVYNELGAIFGGDHSVTAETPTSRSVWRFLGALDHDEVLQQEGITVGTTTGLMMGCCSAEFEIDVERVADLPRLMEIAKRRMNYHRVRRVRAYRPGNVVRGNRVAILCN